MQFSDIGYIIKAKKHGESSLILTVVSKEHGKIVGFARHCLCKKHLPVYQLGNLIKLDAYARLEENMLSLRCELITPHAVDFMFDTKKLATLSAFCELADACLPPAEDLRNLFYHVASFFNLINEDNWITYYSYVEFYLLEFLGISLDLSECSATGTTQNLAYVSPKTAKAVCAVAGEKYKDKLFLYPHYIVDNNYAPSSSEVAELLKMTFFFLNKNFFEPSGLKLPKNRAKLLEILEL